MTEDHITIDPMEEAQWIRNYLINTYSLSVEIITILHITDAQVAYLDHIGLLEEEPDNG